MTKNIGTIDRFARVVVGLLVLALLFVLEGNLRWLGLLGLIPLATAAIGWCPAYSLLGINTCPLSGGKAHQA